VTSNPDFEVTINQRQITRKWYNIELYLQWPTNRKSLWSIERRHFQWPWTTPIFGFKVTSFLDAEYLRNGTMYRHSFNGILIGTYKRPTQQCHFEWSWVILSDLTKYSMTWSVARFFRPSWYYNWLKIAFQLNNQLGLCDVFDFSHLVTFTLKLHYSLAQFAVCFFLILVKQNIML